MSAEQIYSYTDNFNDKDCVSYGLGYKLLSSGVRKSFTSFPVQN